MKLKRILLTLIAVSLYGIVVAQLRVPNIFGDSMVLQRERPIPVWGWAAKGENVTVRFHQQTKTAVAGANGHWRVNLDAEQAGGPYQLVIKGNTQVIYNDVLVGDVWICSGQSNMEWTVALTNNSEAEIAAANYPLIRHSKVPNTVADSPASDTKPGNGWHSANPAQAGSFTAVGYFFARNLYQELQIPIGLINTSWGGTDSETWTSREAFESTEEFKDLYKGIKQLNLDSIAADKLKAMKALVQKVQAELPAETAVAAWKEPSFNDQNWPVMKLPGLWEEQSLRDFDGVVWFRKTITLTAEQAARRADLYLNMIDDNEVTYVNGVKVGSTNGYNQKRMYIIPAGTLKEGTNTIAIKVEDTGGGGGLYGEASELLMMAGGTAIPLNGDWKYQVASVYQSSIVGPNSFPSLLFNAMIHPLIPYGIKGAIWYQGESNADRAYQYRKAFPLLITDWRNRWKQGDFPFYFVQLASFNAANGNSRQGSTWAELREAQTMTLALPNTGQAVTTDIGNAKDIHPRNKQDVGKRLAAVALHHTYGKNIAFSGPVYQSMKVNGKEVTVSFTHNTGLTASGQSGIPGGFEIAGKDQQFYPAKAKISGNRVLLTAEEVPQPVAIRYAWADDAGNANLFNKAGFPAVPFRTDQWPGITVKGKYRVAGR